MLFRSAERTLILSWARSRRRNGELVMSRLSSFITPEVERLLASRQTARLRSTARLMGTQGSGGRGDVWGDPLFDDALPRWRPERGREHEVDVEDVSQDLPSFVKGERVSHKRFGSGTIEAVTGQGRDAKVTVKFDDEETGTKKLVVAFAGLERGSD